MACQNLADKLGRAITYEMAREILRINLRENIDMPTCFIGPPGIGKTQVVEEVAAEIGAHLCVIPLSCYDASELKGIPRVVPVQELKAHHPDRVKESESGLVTYYAHNFEFPATDNPDTWIFFFDEFNAVPPSTQVPIFQATQKRCITGSYQFPKRNRVVLAGNRPKDSESVQPIPSPIISRVNLHEVTFSVTEWLKWGHSTIHGGIKAFIQNNPDRLCYFTKEMVERVEPYATPRTWAYASRLLDAYPNEKLAKMEPKDHLWERLFHHLAGTVGHETLTLRDRNNKTLLQYIKDVAIESIGETRCPSSRIVDWVQSYESEPRKTQLMMILKSLPELDHQNAALYLKRVQTRDAGLFKTVVAEQPGLARNIVQIPGLKMVLEQLK